MSDQLVQQFDHLSDTMTSFANKKQALLQVLADKERIINKLQADTAKCKVELEDAMSQQKLEQLSVEQKLADNEQEMMNLKEQIKVKDETLAELKEEVMLKKESQKELEKVSDLQQEVAVKEGELAATKNEMSNFHHQLLHQSDLLSATMTSYADKQQALQYELPDKEKIIDELQVDNEMYNVELNDDKNFIQQLQKEQLSMKQELDDKNEEMIEKLRVKDEMLVELKDELILKQNHFDAAVSIQSNELEELQKVTQEQSEKISTLQKDIAQKQEELVVTRNEMSDLHHKFTQQSNDFSVEMACKQTMKHELADKERIINTLEADIVWYKAESNNAKNLIKIELLSMKQKLAENEKDMTEKLRVKEVALAKLKEELTMNQNSLDVAISRHSVELEEWQKQSQEQLDKIAAVQQEVTEKEDDLAVTIDKMSQLNDLLSAEMVDKQKIQDILAYKERMVDKLQVENEMYKGDLRNAKDLIQQLEFEHIQELEKEMMEKLRVKDEVVAELKEGLSLKQNSFDAAVNKHAYELEELQKVIKEQSDKISTVQKKVKEKEEELVVTRNEMSDLHHEFTQQSDLLSVESVNKQTMKHELADKERIINTLEAYVVWYKAESNNAKNLMEQLKIELLSMKQELAENEKEMMEKLRVKEETLTEFKEELIVKQSSFDVAVSKHSDEIEDLQRVTQEQMDKVLVLQKEIAHREEELVVTRNNISDLHRELMQQSEHLSAERADKQTMKHELADKSQIIDKLQVGITTYEIELGQLKMKWSSVKQELIEKMMEKIRVKDESLANLKEKLIVKQNSLDGMNITIVRQSNELEEWQKESQEQLEKISTLQQELAIKEEEFIATNGELSNLQHQLVQLLSATMITSVDKQQELQYVLADKEKIIDELQVDNERYKAELNDAKNFIQQLKLSHLSEKQELADNEKEMMEKMRVKDEAQAELTIELVMKQIYLDVTVSIYTMEMEEWQKEHQEQSNKILTLQKETVEREEEFVVIKKEISKLNDQLTKQSDLLNAEMAEKQKIQNVLASKEKINWRVVDKLEADKEMYEAQLIDAKDLIQQLKMEQISMNQQLADNKREMMEILEVKEEALTELKKELTEKQNSFDVSVSRHSDELEELQKAAQKQVLTLQTSIAEKDEELVETRNEISDLHHQLAQQSDLFSAEIEEKQTMKHELTDKGSIIDMLQADIAMYKVELNNAKDCISQLKMEQLSMKQELADNEKEMTEKYEMLDKLKEEVIVKQDSLADVNITIRKHINLEEWPKESQEQLDKIVALQQEVEEKGEELVTTKSEMSNLHHQMVQQSDVLSAAMTSYAEKEQIFQSVLADKERIIDDLQSDVEMYTAKLNDVKDSKQQLKTEQLSVKQEQEIEKEMTEKIREKDEALAELKEQLTAKQSILDAAVSRHSVELREWEKQSAEQSDKIVTLQQEVAEKEEELDVTRNDLQSAAYMQSLEHTLADKETIIDQLKEDITTYQTEANDIKYHMSQLEKECSSVKQELNDSKKEMTGKMSVKNTATGKLKEELFAKQNSLVDASIVKKQSIELDMLQMKNQGQLEKIQTLRQQVYKKREELLATKDKLFDLNCQLSRQFDQKKRAIADKDTIIKKLKAEIEMYKAESNDAKGLTSQSKVEQLSVKQELVDNKKKEMLESRTQTEARAGASVLVVQNKENDNKKKEMLESRTQTEAMAGASAVQNKEKQPNQAKVVQQETKRKEGRVITNRDEPAQRSDSHTSVIKESCKVSHQNCILAV